MPVGRSALNFLPAPAGSLEKIGRQDKFEAMFREWEKFMRGDDSVDKRLIPRDILDSWVRCRERGLDPYEIPQLKILTKEEFDVLCEKNRKLVQISKSFLTCYQDFISFTSFVVCFVDPQGFIIELRVNERFREKARRENVVVGALWTEEEAGTGAGVIVIKTEKPCCVIGPQHYLKCYHESTAYAAPIFDPDGIFLGGILLFSRRDRANNHAYGMTVAAAHLIENQLKINRSLEEAKGAFLRSEIANSYQRTVMASIPEALIAIDNQGLITLINDPAKKLLALRSKTFTGKNLRSIFGQENRQLLSLIQNNDQLTFVEVRISSGKTWNDYTLTCNPILSSAGEVIGKILILTEIKRVKKLVANMIGAQANFSFDAICGKNPKFVDTVEQAKLASLSRSNVLLLGGSGVGKDVFAQAIHNASERKNAPYIAINCCAIPRDLIASELFGHEEGAFTGSRRGGSQGKFELADGGTIFLDEIGEMPLEMQPILLRVIEDKCVIRVGGAKVRQVDVRIIAATNKDLLDEVYKGNFRRDLYYRLNVFTIRLLPLRERVDDISLLVDYFVRKYSQALGKRIDSIDSKVFDFFQRYEWPGNVRELQNVVERMMNCVQTNQLTIDLIPAEMIRQARKTKPNLEIQSALVDYFVKKHSEKLRKTDQEVLDFFHRYEWSGNVHELQSVVEGMMSRAKTDEPVSDLIPADMACQVCETKPDLEIHSARDFERQKIARLMEMNVSKGEIAKMMNINLSTLYRKLKRYNLMFRENRRSTLPENDRPANSPVVPEASWKESNPERKAELLQDYIRIVAGLSKNQVRILQSLPIKRGITELMGTLRRSSRTKFRNQVLAPLTSAGLVEMTIPHKPNSSKQQYRLTEKGQNLLGILPGM